MHMHAPPPSCPLPARRPSARGVAKDRTLPSSELRSASEGACAGADTPTPLVVAEIRRRSSLCVSDWGPTAFASDTRRVGIQIQRVERRAAGGVVSPTAGRKRPDPHVPRGPHRPR